MAEKKAHQIFYIVLVEPKNSGNIGAVARADRKSTRLNSSHTR